MKVTLDDSGVKLDPKDVKRQIKYLEDVFGTLERAAKKLAELDVQYLVFANATCGKSGYTRSPKTARAWARGQLVERGVTSDT